MANEGKKVSRIKDDDKFRLFNWLKENKESFEAKGYNADNVIALAAAGLQLPLSRDNVRSAAKIVGLRLAPIRAADGESNNFWRDKFRALEERVERLEAAQKQEAVPDKPLEYAKDRLYCF